MRLSGQCKTQKNTLLLGHKPHSLNHRNMINTECHVQQKEEGDSPLPSFTTTGGRESPDRNHLEPSSTTNSLEEPRPSPNLLHNPPPSGSTIARTVSSEVTAPGSSVHTNLLCETIHCRENPSVACYISSPLNSL